MVDSFNDLTTTETQVRLCMSDNYMIIVAGTRKFTSERRRFYRAKYVRGTMKENVIFDVWYCECYFENSVLDFILWN